MVQADVIAISSAQKKRLFSMKNVSLCYKSSEQCLGHVHPIWDALGWLGEPLGSYRCSHAAAPQLSISYATLVLSKLSACIPNWMDAR